MQGRLIAVSTSAGKGERKTPVPSALFIAGSGIEGDAHAGGGPRQVSLLAIESFGRIRAKGLQVEPGDFAENLTTEGIDLSALRLGDRLLVGDSVELRITQIGKECHDRCSVFELAGDCVMPREGIFASVERGGAVRAAFGRFQTEEDVDRLVRAVDEAARGR